MHFRHHVFFIFIVFAIATALSAQPQDSTVTPDTVAESTEPSAPPPEAPPVPQPLKTVSGGTIVITSNAVDAVVTINNMVLGRTPFTSSGYLPGFYSIEVKHPSYHTFTKMIQITGNNAITIDAQLVPLGTGISASSPPVQQSAPVRQTIEPSIATPVETQNNAQSQTIGNTMPTNHGTLDITSNTDEASVIINKLQAGTAPLVKNDLVPGYYEVEIKKDGYKPYRQMVQIKGGDTVTVDAVLITLFSRLIISSTPSEAAVFLNNKKAGTTPYDSSRLKAGTYTVRLEHDAYVPYSGQIILEKNKTDSLTVTLISKAYRDSVNKVYGRRFQIFRQVFFGGLTIGSLTGALYYNSKAAYKMEDEKKAWDAYLKPDLSGYEYDSRFKAYQKAAAKTDKYMKNRDVFYILSLIGAAGFSLSIPF